MKAIGHTEIQDRMEARHSKISPLDYEMKANRHLEPAGIFISPIEKKIGWKLSFTKNLPNRVTIFKGVDSLGYFDFLCDLLSCLISFHLI